MSEPQPAQDDEGNRISGEFLSRILEPLIIQLDDGIVADNKSEGTRRSSLKSGNQKSSKRKSVRFDDGDSKRESKEDSKEGSQRGSKTEEPKSEEIEEIKDENVLVIPPVWIPANREGHALLAYFFFRKVFFFQLKFERSFSEMTSVFLIFLTSSCKTRCLKEPSKGCSQLT